jgi:hypothetical protein
VVAFRDQAVTAPQVGQQLGTHHVLGGSLRRSEAIDLLRRAKAAGYQNLEWTRRDPDLACLHGEPEFEKLFE